MAQNLYQLFKVETMVTPRTAGRPMLQQADIVVGETPSGATLRRRLVTVRPPVWTRQDMRDAAMAFALVFTAAMMLLIG
ncbi:MAG: hypothetical protein ACKOUM_08335 [Sphingopyxis sp.]